MLQVLEFRMLKLEAGRSRAHGEIQTGRATLSVYMTLFFLDGCQTASAIWNILHQLNQSFLDHNCTLKLPRARVGNTL